MRIGSGSGIAGHGDSRLIRPVPDAETLPSHNLVIGQCPANHFISILAL